MVAAVVVAAAPANVRPPNPPGVPTNNGPDGNTPIVAPNDPNNLIGPTGFGDQNFAAADQALPYTIDFENQSSASGPAQQVTISQQLDSDLDWGSFRLGDFGFGGQVYTVPANTAFYQTTIDLTATEGFDVDVTATIDE
jgi:hypothetical protein